MDIKQIRDVLDRMHIPRISGYYYLLEILKGYDEGTSIMEMYRIVAKRNHKTDSAIERSIRYCLGEAWIKNEGISTREAIFKNTINSEKGVPTPKQFIMKLRDLLEKSGMDMDEIGIPSYLKGSKYIIFALKIFDPEQTLMHLYEKIAEHFGVSPKAVERAIRYAKDIACKNSYLGKMTIKEFLSMVVNYYAP